MHSPFLERLSSELSVPTRKKNARTPYAAELAYGRWRGPAPVGAKEAAVVILLCKNTNLATSDTSLEDWQFPLTLRPEHLPRHGGQISLPGGELEQGETHWQAALRELQEELGVCTTDVVRLGPLSPLYVFASNYRVTPYVALSLSAPAWKPQASEVAEVFEMSLTHLMAPENTKNPLLERYGIAFHAPCILLEHRQIWGATCLILGELIAAFRAAEGTHRSDNETN